ncbi:hypothetical protein F511_43394 [Dorcoceras hygrometricum]|uniref:Uncharacterized protein n=1 Tax=Dorcoceras hygrometricum TaxID=472368 RepID=A0A2Z7BPQ0_9LAMI|nr:hypothetical protein F511_43394 [Dorcoceras hygrometricum]
MQAALSKLETDNEKLRSRSEEILNENKRLASIISSSTSSSASLDKLHGVIVGSFLGGVHELCHNSRRLSHSQTPIPERGYRNFFNVSVRKITMIVCDCDSLTNLYNSFLKTIQKFMKPSGDKTGLGNNSDESSTSETSNTPRLETTKFKTMNFVKSSAGQPEEAQSGDLKIAAEPTIWKGRFCGLGYTVPEKSRESWLNKRIEQMRGNPKSGGKKQDQFSRPSMKDMQYRHQYTKPRSNGTYTAYSTHTRIKNCTRTSQMF